MTAAYKGQAPAPFDRDQFHLVFPRSFTDPAFGQATGAREAARKTPATRSRVLLINDGNGPGPLSGTGRMTRWAKEVLEADGFEVDLFDLDLFNLDLFCAGDERHRPSCKERMDQMYEKWTAAHGILIVTQGNKGEQARAIELAGWDDPGHLADRAYGLIVHGDAAGIESTRRALSDWLDSMGLVDAGSFARLDRYLGYYESHAGSQQTPGHDNDRLEDVRNVTRALAKAVEELRAGRLSKPERSAQRPRPK